MSVCKLEKGNVTIDMDIVANTPPYSALWENDTSEGKGIAIAKFKLMFHMNDPRSQYSTSTSYTRFKKIIDDLFPNLVEWLNKGAKDKIYLSAAAYYKNELDLIPERALLTAAQDAVHALADSISDPANKDKTRDLASMRKAMEDLEAVREMVKTAEEKAQTTKGKHAVRKREDPDYIKTK